MKQKKIACVFLFIIRILQVIGVARKMLIDLKYFHELKFPIGRKTHFTVEANFVNYLN